MSKIDFRYWANRYAMIVDDAGKLSPLRLWPSQEAFVDVLAEEEQRAMLRAGAGDMRCKVPLILLKSRQIGGTVISEALLFHLVSFFKNTRAVVASDHPDNSLKLWHVIVRMYDNLPPWMRPARDAKVKATNLHLNELDGDIVVGSGNQKTTLGQGMTVDCAHLTEVSTWLPVNAVAIDEDLKPAFNSSKKHHSLFFIESTGHGGIGNWFYEQFNAARSGDSQFKALFVGWFMCPNKWAMDPEGIVLKDDTISTGRRIERETGIVPTKAQLAWYQVTKIDYQSRGLLEVFYQEFPSTPEEAFQSGVRSAWTLETIARVRDGCKTPAAVYTIDAERKKLRNVPVPEWMADGNPDKADGKLIMWEPPRPGSLYVIGVDVSYGLDGGDSSAIEVLRVGTRHLPDEQVAEWRGNWSPLDVATAVWIVGHIYKDKFDDLPAKVAVEVNPGSPGIVTQLELMRRGYPYFFVWRRPLRTDGAYTKEVGWWTTPGTRPLLTDAGIDAINKANLVVNSPWFVEEMRSFGVHTSQMGRVTFEHAPGYHDDRIMALFIAFYVAHESDSISIAEQRKHEKELREAPKGAVTQFQNILLPYDVLLAKWEESMERWD